MKEEQRKEKRRMGRRRKKSARRTWVKIWAVQCQMLAVSPSQKRDPMRVSQAVRSQPEPQTPMKVSKPNLFLELPSNLVLVLRKRQRETKRQHAQRLAEFAKKHPQDATAQKKAAAAEKRFEVRMAKNRAKKEKRREARRKRKAEKRVLRDGEEME